MKEMQRKRILNKDLAKILIENNSQIRLRPDEIDIKRCADNPVERGCTYIKLLVIENLLKQTGNKPVSEDIEALAATSDNVRYNCPVYEHAGEDRSNYACHLLGPRLREYLHRGKKGEV